MRFFLLAAALALSACSRAGKTTPAAMVGVRESTRAWISDTSAARFADTARLHGSRPGLHDSYEGWVDDRVAVRYGAVAPNEAGYDGAAQWTVEFAQPVEKLAAAGKLDASAKVRLRGMIAGRELRSMARTGRGAMVPFDVGNNVLTDGGTPWMTLADLDQHADRFEIQAYLRSRTGEEVTHSARWSDVARNRQSPPSEAVLAVARSFAALTESRHPEWSGIRLLNLGSHGRNSGFAEEPWRGTKAFFGSFLHPDEALATTVQGGLIPAEIRTRGTRQISTDKAGIVGRVRLELLDGGNVSGRATLNFVSVLTGE